MLRKIKRESVAGLSRLYFDHVSTDYLGLKMKVPLMHGLNNGGYFVPAEFWMGECLKSFVETRKGCVVDVGANVGVYLVKLRVFDRKTEYYGIEPDPACVFYIQELIRLNRFENSRVFCFALADNTEAKRLYTSKTGDKKGSLIKEQEGNRSLANSFDTLVLNGDFFIESLNLKNPIAAIKIDVEGAELSVLRGLEKTIKKHRPYIYCEILDISNKRQEENADSICNLLSANDYAILGICKKTKVFQALEDVSRAGRDFEEEYVFSPQEYVKDLLRSLSRNSCGISAKI